MSREIEKIAEDLFEKIRSRFENVSLGNESAKATADPEKARFFNFDYMSNGENFGNITVSLIDENSLKIYFSKNISEKLDEEQLKEWYEFLHGLRFFAKRNLLTFDTRDISRSNLQLKDIKQVSQSDSTLGTKDINVTNESRLYGTAKHSFENVGTARIRIIHTEGINPEQRGARSRHINAIYVENNQGERFKLAHNKLSGARAMARHIAEGGVPYDDMGQHISSMVQEMADLGRFVRSMRHRTFEDSTTNSMVEAATNYYHGMNRQLNHLKSPKAYRSFVENFEPQAEQLDETDVNALKEKFVKKIFDDRMMAALPLVNKAYQLQEQAHTRQLELVRDVVENRLPLKLVANEGMDEYFKALSFNNPTELVVRVLEDIATRALATPEISEFAKQWSTKFNTINEDSDQTLKEHQALAVKLATHYLRDLRNLKEGLRISESEITYVDFDSGNDVLEEGTWALPESDDEIQKLSQLLANPLPVGTDAENATSALYDLIGDDQLFDALGELAEINGPKADARDTIKWFIQNHLPGLNAKLNIGNQEMDQAVNVQPPVSPAPIDATGQPVQPGVTGAAQQGGTTPNGAVTEDAELEKMLRIAGLR